MPATGCKGAHQSMDGGIKLGGDKMMESIMRQEMETWLKTECYKGGLELFGFYDYLGQIHERTIGIASQFMPGEKPDPLAIKYLKEDVMRYTEYLKEVSDKYPQVLSHDDMWRLRSEMLDIVDKAMQEKGWPFTETAFETLRKVFDDTRKTLLEGVVKCQIGKPGSGSSNPGGKTMDYEVTATIKFSTAIPDCKSKDDAIEQAYQDLSANLDMYWSKADIEVREIK